MPAKKKKKTAAHKAGGAPGKDIDAYKKKRDFTRTSEPQPEESAPAAQNPIFVVHRHEARRLHYDLRLAADGVLKCFAVPKGFSYVPEDKHLAVRTEDHPLRYTEFRGMIPRGEYGGGTMLIWDEGTYEILKSESLGAALETGELKLILTGRRLRGEWHLVCTDKVKNLWLLFKSRDRYARDRDEYDVTTRLDLTRAKTKVALPARPEVMRPGVEQTEAFSDPDWVFEMEFDGLRVPALIEAGVARLKTPKELEGNPLLEPVLRSLGRVHAEQAVLDGVLVALNQSGRPDRKTLEELLDAGSGGAVHYYVFDILHYETWDVRGLPLVDRKGLAASVLPPTGSALFVDHIVGDGPSLEQSARAGGLQGIIAKQSDSVYAGGAQESWQRINLRESSRPAGEDVDFQDAIRTPARGKGATGNASGKVKLGNLDKIYWPRQGFTKGDLIAYYSQTAEFLLPYLRDRPVHLLRYPDGIDGKWFYQKQVMDYVPDWIQTVRVKADRPPEKQKEGDGEVRYMVVQDQATLLYLINLGSIDLHPWMSRIESLESPDVAFIDLDPKESSFANVVRLAREVGKLLRGIGLKPYLKTSGKTGLHISIPLRPGYTYEQSRLFCEGVARIIARENPEIATVERNPGKRSSKVYIDFLQNRREQTIVPPYVVRPVDGAQVSMPLDWDELESDLDPGMFTIRTAPARLSRTGDLFRSSLTEGCDLLPAIARLEEYFTTGS